MRLLRDPRAVDCSRCKVNVSGTEVRLRFHWKSQPL